MPAKNLNDLKDVLYKAFERAVDMESKGYDRYAIAVGTIGQAIVALECEQREARESGYGRLEK